VIYSIFVCECRVTSHRSSSRACARRINYIPRHTWYLNFRLCKYDPFFFLCLVKHTLCRFLFVYSDAMPFLSSQNDRLYLHYQGLHAISGLEEYTGLKVLWLESNGIENIDGVGHLTELRSLFLQSNCLRSVSGLDTLKNLDTLNLSKNLVTNLSNLSCCENLRTLTLSHNELSTIDSIEHLAACLSIRNLDLSNNKLIRSSQP